MKIEQKKLTDTEILLFFTSPLPVIGAFSSPEDKHPLLQNIFKENLAKALLLTADFLYLESKTPENLENLEMLSIAELDDYISSSPSTLIAPNTDIKETQVKYII